MDTLGGSVFHKNYLMKPTISRRLLFGTKREQIWGFILIFVEYNSHIHVLIQTIYIVYLNFVNKAEQSPTYF